MIRNIRFTLINIIIILIIIFMVYQIKYNPMFIKQENFLYYDSPDSAMYTRKLYHNYVNPDIRNSYIQTYGYGYPYNHNSHMYYGGGSMNLGNGSGYFGLPEFGYNRYYNPSSPHYKYNYPLEAFDDKLSNNETVDNIPEGFTLKKSSRYCSDNKSKLQIESKINSSDNKCSELNDPSQWNITYEGGSNNTYDDIIWHFQSPKMTLLDNSIDCNECKDSMIDSPHGMMSKYQESLGSID